MAFYLFSNSAILAIPANICLTENLWTRTLNWNQRSDHQHFVQCVTSSAFWPNPHWTQACKFMCKSFDAACMQVPFACVVPACPVQTRHFPQPVVELFIIMGQCKWLVHRLFPLCFAVTRSGPLSSSRRVTWWSASATSSGCVWGTRRSRATRSTTRTGRTTSSATRRPAPPPAPSSSSSSTSSAWPAPSGGSSSPSPGSSGKN